MLRLEQDVHLLAARKEIKANFVHDWHSQPRSERPKSQQPRWKWTWPAKVATALKVDVIGKVNNHAESGLDRQSQQPRWKWTRARQADPTSLRALVGYGYILTLESSCGQISSQSLTDATSSR